MASHGVFARDDTMFGVCEALGEDFGFNPTILRVLFGVGLFWGPVLALAVYAGCGLLVVASRWLVPDPPHGPLQKAEPHLADVALNDQAQAWEEMARAA